MKKLVILIPSLLGAMGALAMAAYAATGWTAVSVPSTGNNVILLGAAARTSTDAWAVGQQFVGAGQPQAPAVAYHWTGTSWSLTPTPNLGEYGALRSVSASSATDAWAVGFTMIARRDFGTLIEQWNGSAWKIVTSPTPARASVGGPRPSLSLATRLRRVPGRTASVRPSP